MWAQDIQNALCLSWAETESKMMGQIPRGKTENQIAVDYTLYLFLYNSALTKYMEQDVLENPIISQMVKKFHSIYGTRRFCWSPSPYPILMQLNIVHNLSPIYSVSILILSYHLRLYLQSDLLPSGFPTKILYKFLVSPSVLHAPPISFSIV
jgi:hypothetical protein